MCNFESNIFPYRIMILKKIIVSYITINKRKIASYLLSSLELHQYLIKKMQLWDEDC